MYSLQFWRCLEDVEPFGIVLYYLCPCMLEVYNLLFILILQEVTVNRQSLKQTLDFGLLDNTETVKGNEDLLSRTECILHYDMVSEGQEAGAELEGELEGSGHDRFPWGRTFQKVKTPLCVINKQAAQN